MTRRILKSFSTSSHPPKCRRLVIRYEHNLQFLVYKLSSFFFRKTQNFNSTYRSFASRHPLVYGTLSCDAFITLRPFLQKFVVKGLRTFLFKKSGFALVSIDSATLRLTLLFKLIVLMACLATRYTHRCNRNE